MRIDLSLTHWKAGSSSWWALPGLSGLPGLEAETWESLFSATVEILEERESKMASISAAVSSDLALPRSTLHSWAGQGVIIHNSLLGFLPELADHCPLALPIPLHLSTLPGSSFFMVPTKLQQTLLSGLGLGSGMHFPVII